MIYDSVYDCQDNKINIFYSSLDSSPEIIDKFHNENSNRTQTNMYLNNETIKNESNYINNYIIDKDKRHLHCLFKKYLDELSKN